MRFTRLGPFGAVWIAFGPSLVFFFSFWVRLSDGF